MCAFPNSKGGQQLEKRLVCLPDHFTPTLELRSIMRYLFFCSGWPTRPVTITG